MEDWKCLLLCHIEAVAQVYTWQTGVSSQGGVIRERDIFKNTYKRYI